MKQLLHRWTSNHDTRILFLIVAIGFILRLAVFPFVQVVDADAVTRVFIAKKWLLEPHLITEGVWPPLHHYFNAIVIWITGSHISAPIVAHMLLGSLTAIPIYKFTKREFSEKGAWFAALFFILCPVIFRNSFHTLSGIPYCFFVALGMNALSLSIRSKSTKQAIYAGLFLTIAAGFRYEAWLLIALFTGIVLYFRSWKTLIVFWSCAMIFPIFWMIGNYAAHQDFFYGLSGAYKWNIVLEGVNQHVPLDQKVLRWIYFPMTWFFLFSPIVFGWLSFKIYKRWRNKEFKFSKFVWAIPFWVMFFTFMYKASEGTLLMQYRFAGSLILLSAPFTGLLFENVNWTKFKRIAVGAVVVTLLPLSYFWMTVNYQNWFTKDSLPQRVMLMYRTESIETIEAVPRLNDQSIATMTDEIQKTLNPSDGLILDFWTWESSYFMALNSNLDPSNIYQVNGASNAPQYVIFVKELLEKCPKGVIVLKCKSKFRELYELDGDILIFQTVAKHAIRLTPLTDNDHLYAFKYEVVRTNAQVNYSKNIKLCPPENSRKYLRLEVRDNTNLYKECVRKGIDEGRPTKDMIEGIVNWTIEDKKSRGEVVIENDE